MNVLLDCKYMTFFIKTCHSYRSSLDFKTR
jgi:hypothetical protein